MPPGPVPFLSVGNHSASPAKRIISLLRGEREFAPRGVYVLSERSVCALREACKTSPRRVATALENEVMFIGLRSYVHRPTNLGS